MTLESTLENGFLIHSQSLNADTDARSEHGLKDNTIQELCTKFSFHKWH